MIELLVVIAIIAILAVMLIPALSKAKIKAQQVTCINNGKQLALAFQMYSQDMTDFYPPNPDDGTVQPGYTWCTGDAGINRPQEFNPDVLKDASRTLVASYIVNSIKIFHCPADNRVGKYQGADPNLKGTVIGAARSVSLSQAVGTIDSCYANNNGHYGIPNRPTNGPWLTGIYGQNKAGAPFTTFGKASSFATTGPSKVFLTCDESIYSINDAGLATCADVNNPVFIDFPSSAHNNGCGFSFCDGHAEVHKCRGSAIVLTAPATGQRRATSPPDLIDFQWLAKNSSVRMR